MPLDQTTPTDEIGLRVLDLENLGYQDYPWVLASRVAQVFYMSDPQTNLPSEEEDKARGCLRETTHYQS